MEKMKDKVCITILNWNGLFWLKKNLAKVVKFSQGVKIVVIDNNSSDQSVLYIKNNFKSINIILNPNNYGFTKGYNTALKQIKCDYYLILNNDVEVTKDFIKPLFNFLQKNKKFVAVQPKILDLKSKGKFEYAGAAGGFLDYFGIPFCRGRVGSFIESDEGQYEKETSIFWASGACFLVERNSFFKAGGFDETFWMHQEEIDLCWRIQGLGKKIGYSPNSQVYHYGAGTLKNDDWKKNFYNHRNNLLMLFKNLPLFDLIIVLLNRPIIDFLISINHLRRLQVFNFLSILLAYVSFIILIPKYIKKRKPINLKLDGKYNIHIIFLFIIRQRKKFSQIFY